MEYLNKEFKTTEERKRSIYIEIYSLIGVCFFILLTLMVFVANSPNQYTIYSSLKTTSYQPVTGK